MNNENEIVDDLKNWKELIKPYATPEVKLARMDKRNRSVAGIFAEYFSINQKGGPKNVKRDQLV